MSDPSWTIAPKALANVDASVAVLAEAAAEGGRIATEWPFDVAHRAKSLRAALLAGNIEGWVAYAGTTVVADLTIFNPAEPEPLEVIEPAQPLALIRAELAVEARGRLERHDPLELPQVLPDFFEGGIDLDFWLGGQERIEHACLRRAEAKAAVSRCRQVSEHTVLLEPLFGEHSHRAVSQLDHRLTALGGR